MMLELFPCSGGMAEGFRRAGIAFDVAVDWDADACASYEANLGHRPIRMDVRELVRLAAAGWTPGPIQLLVADPPCTPWSKAGKRRGLDDDRDMLVATCELIRHLRPSAFLIGNVPGLDEAPGLKALRSTIGALARFGYCVDFKRLNAADFGVPQHRWRPFWFGHSQGSCITWPAATHGPPADDRQLQVLGAERPRPWVTCREALGHLPLEELGRPVKLRKRGANSAQHGSVGERPARVVGTSNLSDGNVLLTPAMRRGLFGEPCGHCWHDRTFHQGPGDQDCSECSCIRWIRPSTRTLDTRTHRLDKAARTVTAAARGSQILLMNGKHPTNKLDEPSYTICSKGDGRGAQGACVLALSEPRRDAREHRHPGKKPRASYPDAAAGVVTTRRNGDGNVLAITQGHPIARPEGVAPTVRDGGAGHSAPAALLEWPWERPATTVTSRAGIAPPGHHDESFAVMSLPEAIVLSEKAAAILQGFPEHWRFLGKTKRSRWSMLGQAMPPPLAEAVARAVKRQMEGS